MNAQWNNVQKKPRVDATLMKTVAKEADSDEAPEDWNWNVITPPPPRVVLKPQKELWLWGRGTLDEQD